MTGYPILNQNSDACASIKLGYGTGTVKQYGCKYIALLEMVCRGVAFKNDYYVAFMNCLKDHGYYSPASGNNFAGVALGENLNCRPTEWGKCQYVFRSPYYAGPVPQADLDKLMAWVYSGKPALMCVDSNLSQAGLQEHWILLTACDTPVYTPKTNILAHDPYKGDTCSVVNRFGGDLSKACYVYELWDCPEAPKVFDGISEESPVSANPTNPSVPTVPTTPTEPDIPSNPITPIATSFGANVIFKGNNARAILNAQREAGVPQVISVTQNPDMVRVLADEYPDAKFMCRVDILQADVNVYLNKAGPALNQRHAGRIIFLGTNENSVFGDGGNSDDDTNALDEISKRAEFDGKLWLRLKALGFDYAGGGYAHGTPNILVKGARDRLRIYYAPLFNAGMRFNQHSYSKILWNNIPLRERLFDLREYDMTLDGYSFKYTEAWWLESRCKFYIACCGFDCTKSFFVTDETGVDDRNGFIGNGFNDEDFIKWCRQYRAINSGIVTTSYQNKIINTPYREEYSMIFQSGDIDKWAGYEVLGWFNRPDIFRRIYA